MPSLVGSSATLRRDPDQDLSSGPVVQHDGKVFIAKAAGLHAATGEPLSGAGPASQLGHAFITVY